jgi:hypothetical protein
MATLRTAVKALLVADGTLMGILTGGVYDRRGLNRSATPAAYDSRGQLLPCAVVTVETTTPTGPKEFDFEQVFFQVWLYEAEGNDYANIDLARDRVRALLHRQSVVITAGAVHEILHADSFGDSYDEALGAEMTYERFYAWRKRA